ncbi:MAG: restriction endonuclease, partial [bacterium]
FQHYNILIREAFVVVSQEGEGIIEQIDGVISIDGMLYLVEIKWWKDPVGRPEVSEHLVRLFTRDGVGGIFISASDYTKAAVTTCKEVLAQRTITLCTLHEVVNILQEGGNLLEFLRKKLEIARIEKNPYGNPLGI